MSSMYCWSLFGGRYIAAIMIGLLLLRCILVAVISSNLEHTGRGGGQGGSCPPPNSGSLSTTIRAESRHYSGKTQYMFD